MTREELQRDMEALVERTKPMLGDETKKDEYKSNIEKIRNLGDQVRAWDKAEADMAEVRAAAEKAPAPELVKKAGWGDVRRQLVEAVQAQRQTRIDISGIESRAWTGAGYGTAPGIIRALIDGGRLRKLCNIAYGKNANTVVQAMTTSPAVPVGTAPGATGTSSDSSAVFAPDAMTLKAWYSTLPVPMSVLLNGDLEAELPALFEENFGAAIDKMVCVGAGSGSDGLGVFIASTSGVSTSSDVTATGSGAAPVWADYISASLTALSLNGNQSSLAWVVNPSVFSTALGVATGSDPNKAEFLSRGTILGIPVILSGYGLTTLASGSYVGVVGYFKHYTIAIAQEIMVDQIKTVGSDNVTFQAFMYMQGKPTIGSSFRRLKTG